MDKMPQKPIFNFNEEGEREVTKISKCDNTNCLRKNHEAFTDAIVLLAGMPVPLIKIWSMKSHEA